MTVAVINHGNKEKLNNSLIPSQTKFIFGVRIPLTIAILARNLCTKY